jgi:hypothetical protein
MDKNSKYIFIVVCDKILEAVYFLINPIEVFEVLQD